MTWKDVYAILILSTPPIPLNAEGLFLTIKTICAATGFAVGLAVWGRSKRRWAIVQGWRFIVAALACLILLGFYLYMYFETEGSVFWIQAGMLVSFSYINLFLSFLLGAIVLVLMPLWKRLAD